MASVPTGLNTSGAGDPLRRMHVTRPKSAKGRTRTVPQSFSHNVEAAFPCCTSPPPRVSSVRSSPSPRLGQDEIPELMNQLPCRPPSSSLNRYRVLPSIGASGAGNCTEVDLVTKTSSMKLSLDKHERQTKSLYREQSQTASSGWETGTGQKQVNTVDTAKQERFDEEPRLLLAIRCHCGQRFEQYFHPSDTLHTVLAAAEEKTGVTCKDCTVETMEVPTRRFLNLGQTLQQCGIPNKSVLCIRQDERD